MSTSLLYHAFGIHGYQYVGRSRCAAEKKFISVYNSQYCPISGDNKLHWEVYRGKAETNRFNKLYQRHLRLLKLQGKSQKTIDAYARAVRRISEHFDRCPDKLTLKQPAGVKVVVT